MKEWYQELETFLTQRYEGWEGQAQFKGTGVRLQKMYEGFCWDSQTIDSEVRKSLKASFKEPYNEMLVMDPIKVWTLCPHHLLPCEFKVHIGYLPYGKVLGLSKFVRIAVALGRRPIMQEMYSRELADTLFFGLNPKGVGVLVVGYHGCMSARGVLQHPGVTTSVLKGEFLDDPSVKTEFLRLALGGRD